MSRSLPLFPTAWNAEPKTTRDPPPVSASSLLLRSAGANDRPYRITEEDWEVFLDRHSSSAEVTMLLTSPSIPTSNPSIASLSSLPPSSTSSNPQDTSSIYSSASYGRGKTRDVRQGTSMHLLSASGSVKGPASVRSARTNGTVVEQDDEGKSKRTAKSLAPSVPEHKIKFEEFHNQVSRGFGVELG